MREEIRSILNDIYEIEPALKEKEAEVVKVIERLMSERPQAEPDAAFVARLRTELALQARGPVVSPWFSYTAFRGAVFGAALAVLVIVPILNSRTFFVAGLGMDQVVKDIGNNAFGAIGSDAISGPSAKSFSPESGAVFRSDEGRGGGMAVSGFSAPSAAGGGVKFKYSGSGMKLSEGSGIVFRREKGEEAERDMARAIASLNFPMMDFGSWNGAKVGAIEISEDVPYGYIASINMTEGLINISPNWKRWPPRNEPSAVSLPSDEELIALADSFLDGHGISVGAYGDPIVDKREFTVPSGQIGALSAPESVNVVYPLFIEGIPVFEDGGGMPYGLTVSVNVPEKRVSGAYNIASQIYTGSSYELVTDSGRVIESVVAHGYSGDGPAKVLTFGDPKRVLIRHVAYDEATGASSELYIPAYLFEMENASAPNDPPSIIVPAVKEFFAES